MNGATVSGAVGAWSHRIARAILFTMFALIPVHYFVPCEASDILGWVAMVSLIIVGGLSVLARRFAPFAWGLLAMLLHAMSVH